MSLAPDPVGYLKSWSSELSSQALRIRQLIGDKHWPSDGRHKELLLTSFLRRYLPAFLELGTGFITAQSISDSCSREIDIIINDPSIEPAWLHESGIIITPPAPVLGQIQVKSEYTVKALTEIAEGFASSASMFAKDSCWFGGFFYDFEERSVVSLGGSIKIKLTELLVSDKPIFLRTPICLSFLSGALFLIDAKNNTKNGVRTYTLRSFKLDALAPAVFFAHLFQHIAQTQGQKRMIELTRYIAMLENSIVETSYIEARLV